MKNLFFLFPTWTENQWHGNQKDGAQSPAGNRTSKNHVTIFMGRISNSPPSVFLTSGCSDFQITSASRPPSSSAFCSPVHWSDLPSFATKGKLGGKRWKRHSTSNQLPHVVAVFQMLQESGEGPASGTRGGRRRRRGCEAESTNSWRDLKGWLTRCSGRASQYLRWQALELFLFLECCVEGQTGCTLIHMNMNMKTQPLCERACVCQALIQSGGCESLCNLSKKGLCLR